VLVPCFDEAPTIAKVVEDFRATLPGATVYVYDNCSTDGTAEVARAAGACVRSERRSGKGHVVRRMLADVEADVYVLVDGDDTYDAGAAPAMVDLLLTEQLDMVTGVRQSTDDAGAAYRRGHVVGNRLFTGLHRRLFGDGCTDVFSGYRVLSRRFAKSFPAGSSGFEIEAEMTAHALDIGAPIDEFPSAYVERVEGSESKLRTYRDGLRILVQSIVYFKELHPFRFFAALSTALFVLALALGIPVIVEFADSGTVPRLPTALLSLGIVVVAFISLNCGIVLHSLARARREAKKLHYLAVPRWTDDPRSRGRDR
ncbi:MAG: glycosyltransferase family 2 protein, partial [Acidimicrobiia bacterium]